ncbi:MAG TPA: helix-turn-helix domain-containing protein [Lacunisphaera sp.]|jgi:transcriptional regulator GlxA family with amidase domain
MKCRLAQINEWEIVAVEAQFKPSKMAALCAVSLRQLERYFMDRFQQPPGKWARALRCRLACDLIAKGWSNKAVAFETHFSNESHLCHEFAYHYGEAPQKFSPTFLQRTKSENIA